MTKFKIGDKVYPSYLGISYGLEGKEYTIQAYYKGISGEILEPIGLVLKEDNTKTGWAENLFELVIEESKYSNFLEKLHSLETNELEIE